MMKLIINSLALSTLCAGMQMKSEGFLQQSEDPAPETGAHAPVSGSETADGATAGGSPLGSPGNPIPAGGAAATTGGTTKEGEAAAGGATTGGEAEAGAPVLPEAKAAGEAFMSLAEKVSSVVQKFANNDPKAIDSVSSLVNDVQSVYQKTDVNAIVKEGEGMVNNLVKQNNIQSLMEQSQGIVKGLVGVVSNNVVM